MRTQSRRFVFERPWAKKSIAVALTGVLVASMGSFHLWGPTDKAQAAGDDAKVDVYFQMPDDVKVTAGGLEYDSRSSDACQVAVADDFHFTIETTETNRAIDKVTVALKGAPLAAVAQDAASSTDVDDAPSLVSDDSSDDLSEASSLSTGETVSIQEKQEPIAATAAVLQQLADEEATPAAQSDEGEVLADDAVPMAAAPQADEAEGDNEDADSTNDAADDVTDADTQTVAATMDPDTGEWIISQASLEKAAEAKDDLVVVITSTAEGDPASDWQTLKDALARSGEVRVTLTDDVTVPSDAEAAVIADGAKTLDLNGHDIVSDRAGNLFTVGSAASFTIDDTYSKHMDLDTVTDEGKLPNPADEGMQGDLRQSRIAEFAKRIGRQAVVEGDTLTYYVARSYVSEREVGVTTEYQIKHTVDMSKVGTITANAPQNLIYMEKGATVTVEGGRLTLAQGIDADIHAVDMNRGGTFHMTGGYITNFYTQGSGAAVSANTSKDDSAKIAIEVTGNAVIAGNHAKNNGGALWARSHSKSIQARIEVSGNAVLAGNIAGGNSAYEKYPNTHMADTANGGAIYAQKNCAVTLTGSSVLAGNVARADGGGVYISGRANDKSENTLTISENATITNNRSENDRTKAKPTNRSAADHPAIKKDSNFWKNVGGGGGGVVALDTTTITGGQITGNYSADGGGGIFAVGGWKAMVLNDANAGYEEKSTVYPLLKISNCIVASNYAGLSEGGGIMASTNKNSIISSGYITNNMTGTYYDYGGGGLFLVSATQGKETGMTLMTPLVKGNTAAGLGGGVASCTNGVVVSANAAVFDNTALADPDHATQNPNEYGDQWLLEGNLRADEFLDKKQTTYGLKGKNVGEDLGVEAWKDKEIKDFASDFYCAKESVVHNKMLGGGYYNWEGFTTGREDSPTDAVKIETAEASRPDWNEPKTISLNNGPALQVNGVFYRSNSKSLTFRIEGSSKEALAAVKELKGYEITYNTVNVNANSTQCTGSGLVERVAESDDFGDKKAEDPADLSIVNLYLTDMPDYKAKESVYTLEKAHTRTENATTGKSYRMAYIAPNSLGETATYVDSQRLAVLHANPSQESKDAAERVATLYVTGNYSNTHGGGIACNDYIDIGGGELPDPPDEQEQYGALKVAKTLTQFNEKSGSATAIFNIVGYTDYEAYKAQLADEQVYANTISMTFNPGKGSQTVEKLLTGLPLGYYEVSEVFYAGDNFREEQGRNVRTFKLTENATVEAPHEVAFTNTYKDEHSYGTGVVNTYGGSTDENGKLVYDVIDGTGQIQYEADDAYSARRQPTDPIEGGN